MRKRLTFRQWVGWALLALVLLVAAAIAVWRGDILRAGLDPQVPFQTYDPPPAPDYGRMGAWALWDARGPRAGEAAVFFVHSTTFDGRVGWNGAIGDAEADAYLNRVVIPNYAGPFERAGSISVPRYRQASLYTRLTLRDDAREARAFRLRRRAGGLRPVDRTASDGADRIGGRRTGGRTAGPAGTGTGRAGRGDA